MKQIRLFFTTDQENAFTITRAQHVQKTLSLEISTNREESVPPIGAGFNLVEGLFESSKHGPFTTAHSFCKQEYQISWKITNNV